MANFTSRLKSYRFSWKFWCLNHTTLPSNISGRIKDIFFIFLSWESKVNSITSESYFKWLGYFVFPWQDGKLDLADQVWKQMCQINGSHDGRSLHLVNKPQPSCCNRPISIDLSEAINTERWGNTLWLAGLRKCNDAYMRRSPNLHNKSERR